MSQPALDVVIHICCSHDNLCCAMNNLHDNMTI